MHPPAFLERAVPLSAQCRFAVGGPADYFARVGTPEELATACRFATAEGLSTFVYSGGSNIFFDSAGFRGLVVRMQGGVWAGFEDLLPATAALVYQGRDSLSRLAPSDDAPPSTLEVEEQLAPCVYASAGYDLSTLVRELAARDLGGIEWLGNIPGSLGGALAGNAGCYGHAIAEVLVDAELMDAQTLERRSVGPEFFDFAYRHSKVKDDPSCIITAVTLRLAPRPGAVVLSEVEAELAERRRKHPHDAQCAGSFFKNPSRERPAWKLLEEAGLRGASVGGALLHPKHLNFLVNAGGAGSADILALARQARAAVLERCGVALEAEVRYIGALGAETI